MNEIKELISLYELLIDHANEEIKKPYCTSNLEIYIKGTIDAYNKIITDLKNLKNE